MIMADFSHIGAWAKSEKPVWSGACRAGLGAVAGVADDGGEGAGCGVGDGDVDGDLVQVLVVQGLQVEGLVKLLLAAGRGLGEQVA
jgi:hypothetical protein